MNNTTKITGQIIRILDTRTAIINLGRNDGITDESIFSILGDPEEIIDPSTGEVLGALRVVKSKLKATQINERFTIATTRWTIQRFRPAAMNALLSAMSDSYETEVVDQGEMHVDPKDVKPWKAQSEVPVRIGDIVEVNIKVVTQESLPLLEDDEEYDEEVEEVEEVTSNTGKGNQE